MKTKPQGTEWIDKIKNLDEAKDALREYVGFDRTWKEMYNDKCIEIQRLKNQPVISEEEIEMAAEKNFSSSFSSNVPRRIGFIVGAKWALSLSSNDKQEKKP